MGAVYHGVWYYAAMTIEEAADSPEDVKTIYDALRTYLHLLVQQPAEDYEEIARTTKLIIAIKPQAVEASQEIANRNTSS